MGIKLTYIYGQTPLSDEERQGLKITTINSQGELDEFEQLNIEKAVEWSLRANLNKEKILSEYFVKELHKRMFNEV